MFTRSNIVIAILCVLTFLLAVAVTRVLAHDWYDMECCSGMDCAPVDSTAFVSESPVYQSLVPMPASPPQLVVTTKHGTAVVPANMPRRESKDHRMHACIRGGKVICIFSPPGS